MTLPAWRVREVMDRYAPDAPERAYLVEGFVEGSMTLRMLEIAYEAGDMTQAGVLSAAKSIEELDFDGVAPTEQCAGDPNDIVQRTIWIGRPDPMVWRQVPPAPEPGRSSPSIPIR